MIFLQNELSTNHSNNYCLSSMIFYMTTTSYTGVITTAAVVLFMQVIVSVNTAVTGNHIWPDTEITTATVAALTRTKSYSVIHKNILVANESPKLSVRAQPSSIHLTDSTTTTKLKSFPTLNPFNISSRVETNTQLKYRSAGIPALGSAEGECKFFTTAWGDVDPNIFYICDTHTKNPIQLSCPKGKGFFLGLGHSGCIPYEQWPACISSKHHEQVIVCKSEHMQQPWEHKDPNKFYVCLKDSMAPTMLNCEPGKGFVHATVTSNSVGGSDALDGIGVSATSKVVGCANWAKWRNYMHCNDYY